MNLSGSFVQTFTAAVSLGDNVVNIDPPMGDFRRALIEQKIRNVNEWFEEADKLNDLLENGRRDDNDSNGC